MSDGGEVIEQLAAYRGRRKDTVLPFSWGEVGEAEWTIVGSRVLFSS
jgi:hypothetical protein